MRRVRLMCSRALRVALAATLTLAEVDSPAVIQAWFQGLNPELSDCSPARLLREDPLEEAAPRVLDAARAHLAA